MAGKYSMFSGSCEQLHFHSLPATPTLQVCLGVADCMCKSDVHIKYLSAYAHMILYRETGL